MLGGMLGYNLVHLQGGELVDNMLQDGGGVQVLQHRCLQ